MVDCPVLIGPMLIGPVLIGPVLGGPAEIPGGPPLVAGRIGALGQAAAPSATTAFGSFLVTGRRPNRRNSVSLTSGIAELPPTR